jgi:hypothetical protein
VQQAAAVGQVPQLRRQQRDAEFGQPPQRGDGVELAARGLEGGAAAGGGGA